jgi:hypothetical protein
MVGILTSLTSTLKTEAISCSETFVTRGNNAWHYKAEDLTQMPVYIYRAMPNFQKRAISGSGKKNLIHSDFME